MSTSHNSLPKTIFPGTLKHGLCHGQKRECWMDNIKEWMSLPMPKLLMMASHRKDWKSISAESSLMSCPHPPPVTQLLKATELNCWSHIRVISHQALYCTSKWKNPLQKTVPLPSKIIFTRLLGYKIKIKKNNLQLWQWKCFCTVGIPLVPCYWTVWKRKKKRKSKYYQTHPQVNQSSNKRKR